MLALCVCPPAIAAAQATTTNLGDLGQTLNANPSVESHFGASLVVSVRDEKKSSLDRQAVIKLYDVVSQKSVWQATGENSQTAFIDLTLGKYTVEASAVGYLTETKDITVYDVLRPTNVHIVLKRDPEAIDLNVPTAPLPKKASMATKRAITALNSNKLKEAQKQLDAASKLAPASGHINFLLGYLSYRQAHVEEAQSYLEKATELEPRHIQALTLLGRVYLHERAYPKAQAVLERAVAIDPNNWMAHNLSSDAYVKQHDYPKALAQADLALEGGQHGSAAAQVSTSEHGA